MLRLDDMCAYLKLIQDQQDSLQFLLQEIHFLVLYSEALINIKIQLNDNINFTAREILLEWRKLKKTDLPILNYLTKSYLQRAHDYPTHIFHLANLFNQLLHGLKKDSMDLDTTWNTLTNLLTRDLLLYLTNQGKVDLLLMLVWTFKQILENGRTPTKFMT